ncbi:testis-expressed protein 9 isoform X5 [Brienomyrus brachyistius]|uniref:testis-expressed protein 9 isoform X5 n=1 Tax=Brienomyrus brachyistius TaxID=42636 RepID=UPI0020B303ED|nr:testis-expressed protein 9 isoform X5 [Brienomyrus brachyistius]
MTGDGDACLSAAGKMAEAGRTSSSQEPRRASSSRTRKSQGGRPFNRPSTVPQLKAPQTDLLLKEEEYKRLNAELEAKTAELVQQAEELMREQNEVLAKPIPSHIGFNLDIEDDEEDYSNLSLISPTEKQPPVKAVNKRKNMSKNAAVQNRPPSGQQIKSKALAASAADDVAIVEDSVDFSLAKTISSIKGKMEEGATPEDVMDDVMPSVGEEMGSEAQIRYLKAKLRVTQEEVNRLCHECNKKVRPALWHRESRPALWHRESRPALWHRKSRSALWHRESRPALWHRKSRSALWHRKSRPALWHRKSRSALWHRKSRPALWHRKSRPALWHRKSRPALWHRKIRSALWHRKSRPALWHRKSRPALWHRESRPARFQLAAVCLFLLAARRMMKFAA